MNRKITASSFSCMKTPFLISIEGNIGTGISYFEPYIIQYYHVLYMHSLYHMFRVGKSTIMKYLKLKHPQFNYIDEPLNVWSSIQNNDGKNLLETYYSGKNLLLHHLLLETLQNSRSSNILFSNTVLCWLVLLILWLLIWIWCTDPKRWGYTFQMFALLTRFHNIQNAINKNSLPSSSSSSSSSSIYITERCLDTDYHCFSQMLKASGNFTQLESQIYDQFYHHFKSLSVPLKGTFVCLCVCLFQSVFVHMYRLLPLWPTHSLTLTIHSLTQHSLTHCTLTHSLTQSLSLYTHSLTHCYLL